MWGGFESLSLRQPDCQAAKSTVTSAESPTHRGLWRHGWSR